MTPETITLVSSIETTAAAIIKADALGNPAIEGGVLIADAIAKIIIDAIASYQAHVGTPYDMNTLPNPTIYPDSPV